MSFLSSPPQSTDEKDFHRQPCFFFLLDLLTFDLGLNLKQWKQGNEKKKEKKKKRNDETKGDGKQRQRRLEISFSYFYKRQLLIVKFFFFFLEKAEIGHIWCSVKHDSASNQYRLHA